jgi:uncharacterized phage-like protein YoqJ
MTDIILGVTGHRPDKLGGYGHSVHIDLVRTAKFCLDQIKPVLVNTGMALGWDQAVADACIQLNIPFDAYVPCPEQPDKWPAESKKKWEELIKKAHYVRYSSDFYHAGVMNLRNRHIVDNSNKILALWNGDRSGGTFNCVDLAVRANIKVLNAWEVFKKARGH